MFEQVWWINSKCRQVSIISQNKNWIETISDMATILRSVGWYFENHFGVECLWNWLHDRIMWIYYHQ